MNTLIPDSVDDTNVNDEIIHALVNCKKIFENKKRRKFIAKRQDNECDYVLLSEDGRHRFVMKVRQSTILPDSFSVILIYVNKNEDRIILYRCNGPHPGRFDANPEHFKFHTHIMTASDWQISNRTNPGNRNEVDGYSTIEEAVSYFLIECAIDDMKSFFINWRNPVESIEFVGQLAIDDLVIEDSGDE